MSTPATLDVGQLPVYVSSSRAPLWWGMLFLVTIESVVFGTFLTSYFYYRSLAPHWPPAGTPPPELFLPTLNTLVLIMSSVAVAFADKGIRKGDVARLRIGLVAAILFSAVFLALKVVEYADATYFWDTHAYGSLIWTVIVFHSAHVASVMLKGTVVAVLAFRGYFDAERHLGVDVNGLYWHFVVAIWIPIYLVLYWAPRL
jgi:cytochrome c oxidase subunit III